MNDKEKLQYLYEKEKAKEEKQERKQGNVLFAGGMVAYLFIAAFKIVVMSFSPLLFFYFILGIGGMSLIILSLIAGAVFFYIKEGKDIKEEMGNRAMMDEVRNGRLPYLEKELRDDTIEIEEKEISNKLENNLAEEQKNEKELIPEEKKDNQEFSYIQKSIINGFLIIVKVNEAFNNMPIVKSYIKKHGLKSAEEIPYLRENFYIPLSNATDEEKFKKVINKYGYYSGAIIAGESDINKLKNWKRIIEINDTSLLNDIFDKAIREAMKKGNRESYYDIIYALENLMEGKDLKKYFDYHSEKEWKDHVGKLEKSTAIIHKLDRKRSLTENEKREIGLIS